MVGEGGRNDQPVRGHSQGWLVVSPLRLAGEPPDEDFIALDSTHAAFGDMPPVDQEEDVARRVEKAAERRTRSRGLAHPHGPPFL
jgi:hypothetical protein